jgi:hypothetical protein
MNEILEFTHSRPHPTRVCSAIRSSYHLVMVEELAVLIRMIEQDKRVLAEENDVSRKTDVVASLSTIVPPR